ncbi:MAG: prepilin-type N-terminal cleavage/methylation domain-containing protein, partial [Blastocatellia bacterium]
MKMNANARSTIDESDGQPCQARKAISSDQAHGLSSKSQRGFTMAELMIAMAVFTLIVGSVVALLGKSQ